MKKEIDELENKSRQRFHYPRVLKEASGWLRQDIPTMPVQIFMKCALWPEKALPIIIEAESLYLHFLHYTLLLQTIE